MTKPKPIFKKKEIVVAMPEKGSVDLGGTMREVVAEVLYVGEQQELYQVGDKILFHHFKSNEDKGIKYFGTPLLRFESETYVICKLEE